MYRDEAAGLTCSSGAACHPGNCPWLLDSQSGQDVLSLPTCPSPRPLHVCHLPCRPLLVRCWGDIGLQGENVSSHVSCTLTWVPHWGYMKQERMVWEGVTVEPQPSTSGSLTPLTGNPPSLTPHPPPQALSQHPDMSRLPRRDGVCAVFVPLPCKGWRLMTKGSHSLYLNLSVCEMEVTVAGPWSLRPH